MRQRLSFHLLVNVNGIGYNNGSELCHSARCLLRQVSQAVGKGILLLRTKRKGPWQSH